MRCLSNVIAVSSIDAQAHACVDQGTTLTSNRAHLELHHRVSGLVQREFDDMHIEGTVQFHRKSGHLRVTVPEG
jgi:hypothetical protein